ncbi:NAD(P)/FAD-dependent oxidoreductase [Govanella unica]|uniref:FAD-binding oxidoreductase n=1 Tax=Govanella unica TaxID=2975056 RepID=A0A9X3Z7G1_9PROT|nr:FAD-binding oxidoreductase [Govania unica]MDA5194131.1 FAD-binding oxidoreductase [Govania unica]
MRGPFAFDRVLWAATARERASYPMLDCERSVDCVIIGAGFTGLSAALHLAEGGRSVAVLEAREPGFGASGRNAGGFLSLYLDHSPSSVEKLLGRERGRRLNEMVAGGPRLVRELLERHRIDADFDGRGIVVAAHNRGAEAKLETLGQEWRSCGAGISDLSREALRARTGSGKFGAGLLFTDGGTFNPLAYVRGLARAAKAAGAEIYGETTALGITPSAGQWRVTTAAGVVLARQVLIATDGYAAHASLWPGLERTYYQIPVAMVTTAPLPEDVATAFRARVPVADGNKNNPLWLKLDGSNRLVASLLPPRGDDDSADQVARPVMEKIRRLYGAVPELRWDHFWIGLVGIPQERLPRALALADGVCAVGGYSGQGIAAATAAGQEYAAYVMGGARQETCRLPFLDPRPVPLQKAVPRLVRSLAGPLSRITDKTYSNPVK